MVLARLRMDCFDAQTLNCYHSVGSLEGSNCTARTPSLHDTSRTNRHLSSASPNAPAKHDSAAKHSCWTTLSVAWPAGEAVRLHRRLAPVLSLAILSLARQRNDQQQAACTADTLAIRASQTPYTAAGRDTGHARAATHSTRVVGGGNRAAGCHGSHMAGGRRWPARSLLVASAVLDVLRHWLAHRRVAEHATGQRVSGRAIHHRRGRRDENTPSGDLLVARPDGCSYRAAVRTSERALVHLAVLPATFVANVSPNRGDRRTTGRYIRNVTVPQNPANEHIVLRGNEPRACATAGRTRRPADDASSLHRPSHRSPAIRRGRSSTAQILAGNGNQPHRATDDVQRGQMHGIALSVRPSVFLGGQPAPARRRGTDPRRRVPACCRSTVGAHVRTLIWAAGSTPAAAFFLCRRYATTAPLSVSTAPQRAQPSTVRSLGTGTCRNQQLADSPTLFFDGVMQFAVSDAVPRTMLEKRAAPEAAGKALHARRLRTAPQDGTPSFFVFVPVAQSGRATSPGPGGIALPLGKMQVAGSTPAWSTHRGLLSEHCPKMRREKRFVVLFPRGSDGTLPPESRVYTPVAKWLSHASRSPRLRKRATGKSGSWTHAARACRRFESCPGLF